MAIKLEIQNPDGSHYWTEHFNDQVSADNWLNEEKTRPYWNTDNICSMEELTAPPVDPQDLINAEARAYLASTDWMVIRSLEHGTLLPSSVSEQREAARARVK